MTWSTTTRQARGYGRAWELVRLRVLKRDRYLCCCADCKGGELRLRPASEVDHVISKAQWLKTKGSLTGVDHPSNLAAINPACHRLKGLKERGFTPRQRIGLDGYPDPTDG